MLIVEDREDDSFLLERMLRSVGVANPILKLWSGDEAITYLEEAFGQDRSQRFPSVIFLDLKMPAKDDGFKVLQWIRDHPVSEKSLILVVSDLHAADDIRHAYELGADSFLRKPLDEAELRECLRNHPKRWHFADPQTL